jgi:glycine oxidase
VRIGIAGAGLLGRLLALQLSRARHTVAVFDPASGPGPKADSGSSAAGWTAAGMLSPVAELERSDTRVFDWGLRSLALWPGIVQSLQVPVDLQLHGSLLLAHRSDAGAAQRLVGLLQAKAGAPYQPECLTQAQLAALEPAIHGPALSWLLPIEGHIHPVQAMAALAAQATRHGVQWHWGRGVAQVEPGALVLGQPAPPAEPAESTDAAARVNARANAQGERLVFDHVFDVRGVGARPQLPVRGVRGEIFLLHAPEVTLSHPLRLMHPRHCVYIVPRQGHHFVVGASEIESEDCSPVSLRSTLELLSAAHSVIPALSEARVVHSEVNLRPAMPDNLPILENQPGITRINGLYRHGWLVAPALVEQALAQGFA